VNNGRCRPRAVDDAARASPDRAVLGREGRDPHMIHTCTSRARVIIVHHHKREGLDTYLWITAFTAYPAFRGGAVTSVSWRRWRHLGVGWSAGTSSAMALRSAPIDMNWTYLFTRIPHHRNTTNNPKRGKQRKNCGVNFRQG
jgi:hypothetical protein